MTSLKVACKTVTFFFSERSILHETLKEILQLKPIRMGKSRYLQSESPTGCETSPVTVLLALAGRLTKPLVINAYAW